MLTTHNQFEPSCGKYEFLIVDFVRTLPEATLQNEALPLRVQLEEVLEHAASAMKQGRPWMVAYFLRAALRLQVPLLAREELEFLLAEIDPTGVKGIAACGTPANRPRP